MKIEFLACWKFYDVHIQNGRIVVVGNDATNFNWGIMPLNDALKRRIREAAEKYRPDDANRMRLVIEAFDEFAERRPIIRFADTDVWEEDSRYFWSDGETTAELTQPIDANLIGWNGEEYVYFPAGLLEESALLENYIK